MGGLMMKKVLAILFILAIFAGSTVADKTSAHYDEMPGIKKAFSAPIHDVKLLK
jgi:hypothetical protein